jgi:signal transduction histidine kinase
MILIVDDRPENIYSLQKLLELNRYRVDTASSGEEALRKILKNTYFLIILDVQMPGMDGFEVAEAITGYSKSKDIPIIFLSAVNVEKKFIEKGYLTGGLDYVTKPFDPDILLLKVGTFYRLHQQARELNEMQKILQDEIAERRNAQEALVQSLEELRSVLESIPQIAFTLNEHGQIEYVNQYWYRFSPDRSQFPDNDLTVTHSVAKAVEDGQPQATEVLLRSLDTQEYRYHSLTLTPVRKQGQVVKWVGMFTDIHEQKKTTQLLEERVHERTKALQEANKELANSNHELQQFAYVASHDLKEPLRKIQVFSNMISSKFGHEQPEANGYLNRVVHSAARMNKLITDLLDYSKLAITDVFQPANFNTIILEIMDDMELLIQEKQAVIRVGEIPIIDAIAAQVRQVFQNILSNALKFSREGVPPDILISAEIVRDMSPDTITDKDGAYCRISVQDNGIGFNEAYLHKIFVIFQRLHGRAEYEGTGIGLAIVKKIIDTHSGLITARSEEGKGSTFYILLPLKQS